MDEQTLNILLECPVCLNTLTESSRVLPCQHTFCSECLEDIVGRRGCLLCPECRTVVTTSIDHLPRNILLMRLLESLKSRRNSHVHLSERTAIEAGGHRFSKSTPCTPDYSASSVSFAFLFPHPVTSGANGTVDGTTNSVAISRGSSDQHISSRDRNILHRRTSAVSIIAQPPEGHTGLESARWRSGLRSSRTTTDLSSLSNSQPPQASSRHGSSDEQHPPVPTISFTEAHSPAQTSGFLDPGLFNQPNWRQSPRNRSLPSNPAMQTADPPALRQAAAASRTTSHPVETTEIPPPTYRASWMPHPPTEKELHNRGPVMEVVFSGQTSRSASQNVFAQRGHVKPAQPIATPSNVHTSKETRSFLKTLFGGHRHHHSSSHDLLAHTFKSLSTSEQDNHRGVWHAEDKTRKACINNFRSAAPRSSKPANFECYRCVTPYPAKNHYELDLHLNDLLYVHQKHSDGWMKATHERTGRNGLIPIAFVERLHGAVSS